MEGLPIIPDEGKLLLIDKPLRWTSFDVVNKLRRIFNIKKIGHAGTLDPLATGLLLVCVGKMTKKIDEFMGLEKEYTGKFIIGQTTPSHDLETTVSEATNVDRVSSEQIFSARDSLTGVISQLPPMHSAIKVGGKRAYAFARKGNEVELQPRTVEVKEFEITSINVPEVRFRIVCSKGTYIRSIVRDFGAHLGVGAYLAELCRTRIGPYRLDDALQLADLAGEIKK